MKLVEITIYKILTMAILAIIGMFSFKVKLLDRKMIDGLSELILTLFTPVLLFMSFQKEVTGQLITGLLFSAGLSILSFLVVYCISKVIIQKQAKDDAVVEHISLIYSNSGFVGIALAQGILGLEGVLYMTVYVAISNVLIWTHGVIVMSGNWEKKSIKKILYSPTIIAILLGVLCFSLRIKVPAILRDPMEMIANINIPMVMMVAGANIAQSNVKRGFRRLRLYYITLIKLLIAPFILLLIFKLIPVAHMIKVTIILATACPSGLTGTLFALRYNKNGIYASEIFAMTTILSALTIPFLIGFC